MAPLIHLANECATEALGEEIAAGLHAGDLIALDGELGAGKTSFVRGLARGLGIDPRIVASPTFITMQSYSGGRLPLVHIDVWRLKHSEELETIGWEEMLAARDCVIVVEWAKRIQAALPNKRIDIQLNYGVTTEDSSQSSRTAIIVDHRSLPL